MKAPDKLYLSELIYSSFQYAIPDPDDEFEVEYINKEVFLTRISEWLSIYSTPIIKGSSQCVVNLTDLKQFLETLI